MSDMEQTFELVGESIRKEKLPKLSDQLFMLLLDSIWHLKTHRNDSASCKNKSFPLYTKSFHEFVGHIYQAAGKKAFDIPFKVSCLPCKEVWVAMDDYGHSLACPKCGEYPDEVLKKVFRLMDVRYLKERGLM